MSTQFLKPVGWWVITLSCVLLSTAHAQDPFHGGPPAVATAEAAASAAATAGAAAPAADSQAAATPGDDARDDDSDDAAPKAQHHRHHHEHDSSEDDVVSIGHKADLPAGQHANTVVAIFGAATSAGDVDDSVVSVLGNTRVTGSVKNAAVAVMGSVYVNGVVDGDVVAVLGNVELGPEARVRGNVVIVGGNLTRDPAAYVGGGIQRVFETDWADFEWLKPWIDRCLLYGRPLAFAHGLGWAWGIALGALALYLFMAFLFHGAVEQCARILEQKPGQSFLAAILTILLTPVVIVLLCITVLGIIAIPFLGLGLLCAAVFGKVVVLATIGRRCTPMLANQPVVHTVVGVLVGSAIVLALYTIPVIGFIVYQLVGLVGMGVVAYALLIALRSRREGRGTGGSGAAQSYANTASAAEMGGASNLPPDTAGRPPPAASDPGGGASATGASASSPPPAPAAVISSTLPRAGFFIRMAALLLDALLVAVVLHILRADGDTELIVLAAYGAVMWKLRGTTIGGIVCGLRVVRLDGRPIDWPTAVVRALSCFLSLVVAGLGFLWIAIDAEKQSWHDKIAGTVVVQAPKGSSLL